MASVLNPGARSVMAAGPLGFISVRGVLSIEQGEGASSGGGVEAPVGCGFAVERLEQPWPRPKLFEVLYRACRLKQGACRVPRPLHGTGCRVPERDLAFQRERRSFEN